MGTQLSEFFSNRSFIACYFCIFFNVILNSLESAETHPSISIQPQKPIKVESIKQIYRIRIQQQGSKLY